MRTAQSTVKGIMRMATANDEIAPLKDRRVQSNPGYLVIILLSRVITRLGDARPDHAEGGREPVRR